MLSTTKLASLSLLSLALGVPAVADAAAGATTYHLRGEGISAQYNFLDGCSNDYVSVYATESITHGSGPPSSEEVFVYGSGYDCDTEISYYFTGSGPFDLLQVAPNQSSAELVANNIPVLYCTYSSPDYLPDCEDMTAVIDLDAQATGPLNKLNIHQQQILDDGTRITQHYKTTERTAQPSGTLTLTDGTTFSFNNASIIANSSGTVTITPP